MTFPAFTSLRQNVSYYARGLFGQLMRKDIFLFSQAIAFKVLVTIVPVLILATGILGRVLKSDRVFDIVAGQVRALLPPYQTEKLLNFLIDLQGASGTITLVGTIGLFISAITLMTTLRAVITSIFSEDYHRARSVLLGYVFDLRMVVQVGVLFLLSIGLTVGVQWINRAGRAYLDWIGMDYAWLSQSWSVVFNILGVFLPLLVTLAMFAQLFYFIPSPRPPRRSVLRGALTTALLWEAAKYGFTFYAANVAGFDVGNTFGLILAFVFWIYYSGLVLCIGALVALVSEKRIRSAHFRTEGDVRKNILCGRRRPHSRIQSLPALS